MQDRTSRLPECLLVSEADRSHLDVVLQVKSPECTWCDLDIHVDLQLQAPLLQAIATIKLQEVSVEQIATDCLSDLALAVVFPVEPAPVDDLLAVLFVSPQSSERRGHWQSQEFCYVLKRLLRIVVHLINFGSLILSDLSAFGS